MTAHLSTTRGRGLRRWAEDIPLPARLRWTAGYFRLSGVMGGLGVLLTAAFAVGGQSALRSAFLAHPAAFVGSLTVGAVCSTGWILTAKALDERRRSGGLFALGALVTPLLFSTWSGFSVTSSVVVSALGTVAILTSWRELE